MDREEKLREATAEELNQALALALSFDGKKRVHSANEFMARITADRLIEHLNKSGFVVMKKPPAPAHSTGSGRDTHLTD